MQLPAPFCILLATLWLAAAAARADAPATEFFAVETAKLTKLAPTDEALASLTGAQLSGISVAHGWYGGGLSMNFSTPTFRIVARFDRNATDPASSIHYNINASNDPESWSLLSVQGTALRQGNQGRLFITEGWRKQPVTVILRYLELKK